MDFSLTLIIFQLIKLHFKNSFQILKNEEKKYHRKYLEQNSGHLSPISWSTDALHIFKTLMCSEKQLLNFWKQINVKCDEKNRKLKKIEKRKQRKSIYLKSSYLRVLICVLQQVKLPKMRLIDRNYSDSIELEKKSTHTFLAKWPVSGSSKD